MSRYLRTLMAALTLCALAAMANAVDGQTSAASTPQQQKVVVTTTLMPPTARLPLAEGMSWVYRENVSSNGQLETSARQEVTTVYQTRQLNWLIASLSLDDTPATEAPASAARVSGVIDHQSCLIDVLATQPLQQLPCVPPGAGETWTLQAPGSDQRRDFKAIGQETIQVPAGSFEALRLEETDSAPMVAGDGTRVTVTTNRIRYWYVPRLMAMARVERDTLRADGTTAEHTDQVLESFGPASEAAKRAVRLTPQWLAHERAQATHARIAQAVASAPPLRHQPVMQPTRACQPDYPAAAIRAMATGTTKLRMVVASDGSVQDAEVLEDSGDTREHRLLDNTALAALSKCSFTPAMAMDGTPTIGVVVIMYSWKLD